MKRRSKSRWANLALASFAALTGLALCEVTLRLFWDRPPVVMRLAETGLHERDPELGWRPKPNFTTVHTLYDHYSVTVSTNSHGFRDSEHKVERAPQVKRLLVLGDSFTFGWGVNNGETFTDRLKADLPGVEVINLGVTGWNLKQYHKILRLEGLAYKPDVVVVAFVQNDVSSADAPAKDAPLATGEQVKPRRRFYTYDLLRTVVLGNKFAYGSLALMGIVRPLGGYGELDDNLRAALVNYPDELAHDWKATLDELAAIQHTAETNGASLLVATIPARQAIEKNSFSSTLAHLSYKPADFDLEKPYRELGLFCKQMNVSYVNGYEALRKVQADLYIRNDMHFNARGHQELAKALAAPLTQILDGETN